LAVVAFTSIVHKVGALSGVRLEFREEDLALASGDFGGMARGHARAVALPESIDDVQRLIRASAEHGVRLTPRGRGLSQSGQSVPTDGISLDLRGLNHVDEPDLSRGTIACGAGASFRDVVTRAARVGMTPKVVPLNLDLSIGGVLSAGGLGSTSHRYGPVVSHVASADVVLGTGETVCCGPNHERRVYDAVLGGLGRVGVIARAELALRSTAARVRTFYLLYDELGELIEDLVMLAHANRADHVDAFCSASVQGFRRSPTGRRQAFAHWFYGLHVSIEYENEGPPADAVLFGLRFKRLIHVEDEEISSFMARFDARIEVLKLTGAWSHAHPWFEVLLPLECAKRVVSEALERLPLLLGDGHRLMVLGETDRPTSFAVPSAGTVIGFAVLPMGVPPVFKEPAVQALTAINDLCLTAGGKRYPSGWLFNPNPDSWRSHYGNAYDSLTAAQHEFDPDGVFDACLSRL
jgi:cytokinin dehydrogenase